MNTKICLLGLLWLLREAAADLKCASRPHQRYMLINENGAIPFVRQNIWHGYFIPSSFGFKKLGPAGRPERQMPGMGGRGRPGGGRRPFGLTETNETEKNPFLARMMRPRGQKYRNYDNFLRSNIDNEHDNREFNTDVGRDALPFRTNETEVNPYFTTDKFDARKGWPKIGPLDLRMSMKAGTSKLVPIRWNNPHAAEIEVNIWIFPANSQPVVVPIRKPACCGEGHQDSIFDFQIPADFVKLGSKIPGFKGCNADTKPMCVVQVYGHSVESRQYAFAWPLVVPGHDASLTATKADIKPMATDPGLDLHVLRDFCLPTVDKSVHIRTSVPRWGRLVSDQYTHAYMNSDYSPYSGQQHEGISKNMQASCINKMWAANHGELGKSILPAEMKTKLDKLEDLEDKIYKRYETMVNMIIRRIERGGFMKSTGHIGAMGTYQKLANCFRCAHVGAVNPNRLTTNTYIPSFQLPVSSVNSVRRQVFPPFRKVVWDNGQVHIYLQSLKDLLPFFYAAQPYGIIYQTAKVKSTLATMPDATRFLKRNKAGQTDNGVYAATMAFRAHAESLGCPADCLYCNGARCKNSWDNCWKPLINGAPATCIKDKCSRCTALYGDYKKKKAPPVTELAAGIASDGSIPASPGQLPDAPDPDGSPRIGRPQQNGEAEVPRTAANHWDLPQGGAQGGAPGGRGGRPGGAPRGRLLEEEATKTRSAARRRRRRTGQ